MRIHVKLENLRQNHLEKSQNNAVREVSPLFSFRSQIRTWTTVPRSKVYQGQKWSTFLFFNEIYMIS